MCQPMPLSSVLHAQAASTELTEVAWLKSAGLDSRLWSKNSLGERSALSRVS